jgi:photosystem II stability/assembly factor-like uncharacterized protein
MKTGMRNDFHGVVISIFLVMIACTPDGSAGKVGLTPWKKLGPGGGGSTFTPTFSYDTPEKFIVRCDMTGSYLTQNGGQSYQQVNFPNGAGSFAYDPKNSDILYIGSATLNRTRDGGKTWEAIFPGPDEIRSATYNGDHASYSITPGENSIYNREAGSITNIRVDPRNSSMIYFTMGRSFYYTEDAGLSWRRFDLDSRISFLYTNASGVKDDVLIFMSEKIASFSTSSGLFKEWKMPSDMVPAFSFTGGTSKDGQQLIFYALHAEAGDDEGEFHNAQLWISKDGGEHWGRATDTTLDNAKDGLMPSYSMVTASEMDAMQAYLVCDRYLERREGKTLHWYGALKTEDGGTRWAWVWKGGGGSGAYGVKDGQRVSNLEDAWAERAFGGEYIRLLEAGVYPKDGNIAILTDWYRTMKTTDGGNTWREIYSEKKQDGSYASRGLDVTTSYGVHVDPFDHDHLAISFTDIGFHHSFNGGKSWIRSVEGVPAEWQNTCYWAVFDPDVRDKIWSVWSNLHDFPRGKMTRNPGWKDRARGGVCVSSDGGKTWSPSVEGMDGNSAATSIVIDRNSRPGERTLYATVYNKGVFKSTNDGKSWALKNNGIEKNTCAFEITLQENGNLFLIVSPVPAHWDGKPGRTYHSGAVYKSTDGAETWKKLSISTDPVIFPNGIGYDPHDPDRIYLACWSDISLADLVGGAVARETGGNETIKSEGGVFMSADGGLTWNSIFDPHHYVYDVTPDPYHEGRLYCNTFNQAAFRSDDLGKTWKKLDGYDFHWGHRVVIDEQDRDRIYITTFGSGVLHGPS